MSWFTSGLEALSHISEKVQMAIPVDKSLLAKLTLNTDEMKAERQQFGDEAARKKEVKNMLAGMLPWETKDSERDILVEECKEAILALSTTIETFYGPYEVPSLNVNLEENKDKEGNEEETEDEDDNEDESEETDKHQMPSEESLEKLAKLEPLPPLLRDFDLDSHVGLIERLLKEDPTLAAQQSTLSGGGPRETVFWQNYFFHCAYTRYEAGLSIDEIWSFKPEEEDVVANEATNQADDALAEELVEFIAEEGESEAAAEAAFVPDETSSGGQQNEVASEPLAFDSTETSPSGSAVSEFEMLEGADKDESSGDPVLDELEAEIARELED